MSFAVKTKVPGSIIVRKMSSGNEYLYYRAYKQKGGFKASGLVYNKKNVKVVEGILEHLYKEQLMKENRYDYSIPSETTTIHQQFEYFLESLEQKELSKTTLYEYQHSFDIIITAEYSPNEYRTVYENGRERRKFRIEEDIELYKKITKHKNNTINKNLRQLQIFVNYLVANNEIPDLNIYRKHKVKAQQKEIEPYSKTEAKKILDRAKETDEVLYLLLKLLYLTGGRIYEWLHAYYDSGDYNVDMKNRVLKFRNKVRREQFQTMPISDKVYEVLTRLKRLEEERTDYKNKVIPYSETSKSSITRKLTKIERDLGIKKKGRSTHGFRRLLATELFDKEIPIDVIKDIMRHSSIEVTMNAYRKYDKKRITESLNKLDR